MKVKIYSQSGEAKGEHEVPLREDFSRASPQVIHDVITAHRAAQRAGTACTKTVAEVAGSGKKPWKQKGTGRARAGYARSPVWRKGGVVFGPKPRDYSKNLPKRVKRLAFEQALSSRLQDGDVVVLESLEMTAPKTSDFVRMMKSLKVEGSALLVHEAPSKNLLFAARNIPRVEAVNAESVNTYQVLKYNKIVLTRAALDLLAARGAAREVSK